MQLIVTWGERKVSFDGLRMDSFHKEEMSCTLVPVSMQSTPRGLIEPFSGPYMNGRTSDCLIILFFFELCLNVAFCQVIMRSDRATEYIP